ncbi:MAG: glycosyltransferase family 39 protein [Ilumatobacteraceae bacterium]|nr:glycosyltransferase family 39 protein [Acidimicrobiaceae bacterium]MBP6488431.1 glycosyltransferase family 39 protein [Ilumatobacteraceae bacterium]MBP7888614.1 glycosyltransferase family 39 protein [Ilumatobacteraceae bacterium]MBP8211398.1 glycosyltransferase family 39 protein [Ilumatobacteraceae bacterium]
MERTREAAPTLRVARWSVPWAWVVFAFALGTGLLMGFVVFRVQSLVDQNTDPYFFGDMGKSIADGNGFEGFGSLITRRAPLYPIVIGGVYAVFGDHQKLIVLLHVLMFSGTCVLAYDMGRRLFNHRTGVIAGFVCALHPMLLRYIPNLHLETQLTLLITLTAWLTIRFYERPTVAAGALVGLASGAAALTKAVALLYPALFVAGIILACRAARRRGEQRPTPWKPILAIFVVMGCLILPWTARNYRSSGHFVLISSGTSDAFLRGFIFTETDYITLRRPPYTDAENASNAYFEALAEAEGTVWERDDYETDQILNKEAKRRLFAEPGPVLRKSVIGVFTFWYQLTSLKNSLLALVLALGAWFFAVIGWRRARREQRPAWLLMLPVLYLNLVLALLLALGRYSVPILPALIVMSAFGVDTLLDRRAARRA